MAHRDYSRWNPEATAWVVAAVLGFVHLTQTTPASTPTQLVLLGLHWAIVGGWWLSYMWRASEQRRKG